jgi:hypothetical protein
MGNALISSHSAHTQYNRRPSRGLRRLSFPSSCPAATTVPLRLSLLLGALIGAHANVLLPNIAMAYTLSGGRFCGILKGSKETVCFDGETIERQETSDTLMVTGDAQGSEDGCIVALTGSGDPVFLYDDCMTQTLPTGGPFQSVATSKNANFGLDLSGSIHGTRNYNWSTATYKQLTGGSHVVCAMQNDGEVHLAGADGDKVLPVFPPGPYEMVACAQTADEPFGCVLFAENQTLSCFGDQTRIPFPSPETKFRFIRGCGDLICGVRLSPGSPAVCWGYEVSSTLEGPCVDVAGSIDGMYCLDCTNHLRGTDDRYVYALSEYELSCSSDVSEAICGYDVC